MGPYIVLGLHRSGTSLVANILRCLGVKMGDEFPRVNKWNPRGYWEDTEFIRLNARILRKAGGKWSKPPDHEEVVRAGMFYADKIKELLLSKEAGAARVKGRRWGWKDPRTCLTIDAYTPFLDSPHYIVVQRDRAAVVNSLTKRHSGSRKKWEELMDIYQSRLDEFVSRQKPSSLHYVRFEDLVNKRRANSEITKLGWFTGRNRFRQQRDRAMKEVEFR